MEQATPRTPYIGEIRMITTLTQGYNRARCIQVRPNGRLLIYLPAKMLIGSGHDEFLEMEVAEWVKLPFPQS